MWLKVTVYYFSASDIRTDLHMHKQYWHCIMELESQVVEMFLVRWSHWFDGTSVKARPRLTCVHNAVLTTAQLITRHWLTYTQHSPSVTESKQITQQPAWCSLPTSMGSPTWITIMIHTHEGTVHSLAVIYHTNTSRVTDPSISVSPQHKFALVTSQTRWRWHPIFIVLGDRTPLCVPTAMAMKKQQSTCGVNSKYQPTQDASEATWRWLGQWLPSPWPGMREEEYKQPSFHHSHQWQGLKYVACGPRAGLEDIICGYND